MMEFLNGIADTKNLLNNRSINPLNATQSYYWPSSLSSLLTATEIKETNNGTK